MPLEHLQFFAVFEANDVVERNRLLHGDRWYGTVGAWLLLRADIREVL